MLQSANQVDESGGSDARQRELNQLLDGLVQQLTALADPSHLTARITRRPRCNTGAAAFVSVDSAPRCANCRTGFGEHPFAAIVE